MALIVEDGTGLSTANSYASVATADAYFSARGISTWAGLTTEKEIRTLTITAACSSDGDLTITLNGVAFTVAVTTTEDSAAKVAAVIRAASFTGWVVTGTGAEAIFTATTAGTRGGSYSLAVASTGVTGSMVQTQAGSDASKEAALVRGSFALDGMYSQMWPGLRSSSAQAFDWPREDAIDIDGFELSGLPTAVVNAACEAALLELVSSGALTPSVTGGVKREKVGPLETEYFTSSGPATKYKTISSALARIILSGGGIKLGRG